MTLLSDALAQARRALAQEPSLHLPLQHRKLLWQALGGFASQTEAKAGRFELCLECLLEAQRLSRRNKYQVELDAIRSAGREHLAAGRGERLIDLIHIYSNMADQQSLAADAIDSLFLTAMAKALEVSLRDEIALVEEVIVEPYGESGDPYDWDCALLCSAYVAGGFPWSPGSSAEVRGRYWLWYLHTIDQFGRSAAT
jgi:hypothetical protein